METLDNPSIFFVGGGRGGPTGMIWRHGWSLRLGGLRLLESGLAPWLIGRDQQKATWKLHIKWKQLWFHFNFWWFFFGWAQIDFWVLHELILGRQPWGGIDTWGWGSSMSIVRHVEDRYRATTAVGLCFCMERGGPFWCRLMWRCHRLNISIETYKKKTPQDTTQGPDCLNVHMKLPWCQVAIVFTSGNIIGPMFVGCLGWAGKCFKICPGWP